MLRRFQESLESTGLVPPGARVLVGYSGGADSTCLLHLLCAAGADVVAAHLHHGQRAEAEDELDKCAAFAESLGVPFVSGRADVPKLAADMRMGVEEAGRQARYGFFESARRSTGCHLIATAHTLDDHAETILLNITRGAGLAGLRGIPRRRDDVIRPLLSFTREETRAHCAEHEFWFHDDPANTDVQFSRARIRHRVLPELEVLNPAVKHALDRLSRVAAVEEDLLNGIAAAALERCEIALNGALHALTTDCELALDKATLLTHPHPIVARGLRLAVQTLGGQLEHDGTDGLVDAVVADRGSWTAQGGEVVVEWDDTSLHLRSLVPTEPYRFPVTVPGETESLEFGWTITVRPTQQTSRDPHCLRVSLDAGSVKMPLTLRSAEAGDRLQPLGMQGSKLVSDMFQESKLTHAARKRLPVICDLVGPVWIPGVCLADRVKMTDSSEQGLELTLEFHSAHAPQL